MHFPINDDCLELRNLHHRSQHVLGKPNRPVIVPISEAVWLRKIRRTNQNRLQPHVLPISLLEIIFPDQIGVSDRLRCYNSFTDIHKLSRIYDLQEHLQRREDL